MDKTSYLNLDIRALHTFLTIMETGSITAAANQLNVTQSAVSHGLEKLRGIFQDELFLRAGRGIKPTPRAERLFDELKPLLANVKALTEAAEFKPKTAEINWTIAANDMQRDAVLPLFYQQVAPQLKRFNLNVIPSEIPAAEQLRDGIVDLVISPIPPDAPDIRQRRLFTTDSSCFFDASARSAPQTLDDFREAQYISLTFMAGKQLVPNQHPITQAIDENVVVRVSNFAGIASFMRGSSLLAVVPTLLKRNFLAEFNHVALPYTPPELNIYMLWHQRYQEDAEHSWLRTQLSDVCTASLAAP